jgi:hypothetical protein
MNDEMFKLMLKTYFEIQVLLTSVVSTDDVMMKLKMQNNKIQIEKMTSFKREWRWTSKYLKHVHIKVAY